jgi:hypothetical protein
MLDSERLATKGTDEIWGENIYACPYPLREKNYFCLWPLI